MKINNLIPPYIIHLVRATTWGGGERYALDLCRESAKRGDKVTVLTKGNPEIDSKFSDAGAKIKTLPLGGTLDFRSPFILARILREMAEDDIIVHVHTFKDAEIAARAKKIIGNRKNVKLVCTRHLVKKGKRSPRWNFIFKNIDALIFVSELAKKVFLEGRPKIDPQILSVIHNSIIPPAEEPSHTPEEPSHTPEEPSQAAGAKLLPPAAVPQCIAIYTGRISPEKGIESLIKALARIKELPISLRIAGTGPEEYIAALKSLAEKEGVRDRIEWLGFVPDIFAEIGNADICVAPSIWREPFGLTIIEFMSQGKPVITTDNGAQKEIITDGIDGLLVAPGDADALAKAIRTLANDEGLRKRMGEEARQTFRSRFSYNIFFNKILDTYSHVLKQ